MARISGCLKRYVEAVGERFPPLGQRTLGSSLKLCLLAAGEADLYPRLGPTSEWDIAAADAVLTAAGGAVISVMAYIFYTGLY